MHTEPPPIYKHLNTYTFYIKYVYILTIDSSVKQVQFMRNSKHTHRPLLEKCNRLLLLNVPKMSAEDISIITGLYQTLQFNNCDFRLASRQRLLELIDSSTDPVVFTKLFATLGPMASQDSRERYGDKGG